MAKIWILRFSVTGPSLRLRSFPGELNICLQGLEGDGSDAVRVSGTIQYSFNAVDTLRHYFASTPGHGQPRRSSSLHVLHGPQGMAGSVPGVRPQDSVAAAIALHVAGQDHRAGGARRRLQGSGKPVDAGPGDRNG